MLVGAPPKMMETIWQSSEIQGATKHAKGGTPFSNKLPSRPGRPGAKIRFFEKWSKPGSEGIVGTRGPPTVPTTPVFLGLRPFAQKLVPALFWAP